MKLFGHIQTLDEFNNMKVSLDSTDTSYEIKASGTKLVGEPQVKWNHIVFIDEPNIIWTNGIYFYAINDSILEILDLLHQRITALEVSRSALTLL